MKRFVQKAAKAALIAAAGLAAAGFVLFWALRLSGYVASARAKKGAAEQFAAHRAAFEQVLAAPQKYGAMWMVESIDALNELQDADVSDIYDHKGYMQFSFEHGVSPFIGQGIFYIRDEQSISDFYTLYPLDEHWAYYQYSSI